MRASLKWSAVLQISNIPKDYWEMVAIYCDNYHYKISDNKNPLDDNTLPISLKILSNLDLSRVTLNNNDMDINLFKTYSISVKMSQDDIDDFGVAGLDIINNVESLLIKEQSDVLNKMILERGGLFIKDVCSQIKFDGNKIRLESRLITFQEYRQLKLKKIHERNRL